MYEGGANVLRLSYSVHRDLNVKNSGDKSRDYSMPLGVPSTGYHQHGQQHHHQQQHYAPNPYDVGGHAPPPHHGGGQFGDEAPVTGATHFLMCPWPECILKPKWGLSSDIVLYSSCTIQFHLTATCRDIMASCSGTRCNWSHSRGCMYAGSFHFLM
jgi:hypothetical protein